MNSKICAIDTCSSRVISRGYCTSHYQSQRKKGLLELLPDQPPKICTVAYCGHPNYARGFCANCYQSYLKGRNKPNKKDCMVEHCPGFVYRENHCMRHYKVLYSQSEIRKPDCTNNNCTEPRYHKTSLCKKHFDAQQALFARKRQEKREKMQAKRLAAQLAEEAKPRCVEDECNKAAWSMDRCQLHYNAWKTAASQADDFWSFVKTELKLENA